MENGHDEEQTEMFAPEDQAEKFIAEATRDIPHEMSFDVEMVLTLKPEGGKGHKVPLLAGSFPGARVEELLELAIKSRRTRKIISAILDNPEPRSTPEINAATDAEMVKSVSEHF